MPSIPHHKFSSDPDTALRRAIIEGPLEIVDESRVVGILSPPRSSTVRTELNLLRKFAARARPDWAEKAGQWALAVTASVEDGNSLRDNELNFGFSAETFTLPLKVTGPDLLRLLGQAFSVARPELTNLVHVVVPDEADGSLGPSLTEIYRHPDVSEHGRVVFWATEGWVKKVMHSGTECPWQSVCKFEALPRSSKSEELAEDLLRAFKREAQMKF
jgi:hypothetical protein